jgi:outer membrane protein assembly factor BamB
MKQRELTFYPETERTRDLIYSEYTSCDRSIHCLLQDNSVPQYRFLLLAYREIVSRYLSGARLQSPKEFLSSLADRLEDLSRSYHFSVDDYRSMGFYLLVRNTDAYYLLTSRRDTIYAHDDGDIIPLSDSSAPHVDRLALGESVLQEELFPESLKDCFSLYRLDADYYGQRDIILGCGEEDRSTVLEVLDDPLWRQTAERRNTFSSKFITRKVLVLRFDDGAYAVQARAARHAAATGFAWKRVGFGLAGVAAVTALAIAIAQMDLFAPWQPGQGGRAMMEAPVEPPTEVVEATNQHDAPDIAGVPAPETAKSLFTGTHLVESWKKTFPRAVTSSPAIFGDQVVFGCRDGNLYALEKSTGTRRWQARFGDGVGASPAVSETHVVAADYAGNVRALEADSGKQLWTRRLPGKVVSSPMMDGDRVLVGCYDGNAYCLSMADGSVLWKHATGGRVRASAARAGGHFVVASYDGNLYALARADGGVVWRYRVGGNVAGSPAVYNNVVVIGAPDGYVHAVGLEDGKQRWKFRTSGSVKSTPAIADGRVYVGSNDRYVYCLSVDDGKELWKYRTGGMVLGRPTVRGGVVYAGSYDGHMYCIEADTGTLVDRFRTEGEIYSSPAADENAVYFGNNKGRFIALNHAAKDA